MPVTKAVLVPALALIAIAAPAAAQQFLSAPVVTVVISPVQQTGAAQQLPDAFQVMNAQFAQMNAVMQQMNAQMNAQMSAQMSEMSQLPTTPAAFGNLPAGVSGFAITTISDGSKSCTERVLYPAGGSPQKVQISETGDACAALHMNQPSAPIPTALPTAPVQPKTPTTIQVQNTIAQKPIMLASRD